MPAPETAESYQSALRGAALCARLLMQYDVPELLKSIEHADAFGCFFDPTLWISNRQAMGEDRELLEAALPLWRWAQKVKEQLRPKEVSLAP